MYYNEVKQRMTSVIEVFHLPTGRWKQQPTNHRGRKLKKVGGGGGGGGAEHICTLA